MAASYEEFRALVDAGATVLHVASFEWERVQGWCVALAKHLDVPLEVWSSSAGVRRLRGDGWETELETAEPIELMKRLRDAKTGGVLLLEDVHPYLAPQHHEVVRFVREMARWAGAGPRGVLVLSTPVADLPAELRKEVPTIELPLPGVEDLRTVAARTASSHAVPFEPSDALFEAARGLTVMEARVAFGLAAVKNGRVSASAVPLVAREKERVIRQGRLLEFFEPEAGLADVGGLDRLKQWLDRRGRAYGAGARQFGLDAPKGVLLLGVQGCGKSLMAKAVASAWQFPLLRLDLGRVFGGLVGESEGNIRAALQISQALAPCVLWIDEIEKGLAGLGSSDQTDGGTSARVVGTLLTWMQEKREPVFVVATANRVEALPPELLRKGRFDELFFVDLPTHAVRKDILAVHLRKKGRDPASFDLERLATMSVGYSGAELEEAVREALYEAFSDGRELTTEHVASALGETYPLSRTMSEQLGGLRQWARARARAASSEEPETLPPSPPSIPRLRQETHNPFVPVGAR